MIVERNWRFLLALVCVLLALVPAAQAGAIHAKALLAQWLLQRAWDDARNGLAAPRPWPGADLHPVARLRLPRLQVEQIVVAGDSGRSIAFGPGWAPASATPGSRGTTVISGHRDTHFAWLRELRSGDVVELDWPQGSRSYRITRTQVADASSQLLHLDATADRLLLVTCWPFDALQNGGTERYVVTAEACYACS